MRTTPLGPTATGKFLPGQDCDQAEHDDVAEHRFGFDYPNQQQRSYAQSNALVDVKSDNTFHSSEHTCTTSEIR
jgi:hypothetical protein